MTTPNKRTTVYLDPVLHKALRLKAIDSEKSVSEIINEVIRLSLTEDAEDLLAFEERKNEPDISFEKMVKRLKLDGRL
jgi:hypothetical protein